MDLAYFGQLLVRFIWNTHNIVTSIWTDIGIILAILYFASSRLEGKMKKYILPKARKWLPFFIAIFLFAGIFGASYSLYKNKEVKIATPEELLAARIANKDVPLNYMTRYDDAIRNRVFDNCDIYGPAVLLSIGDYVFYKNCIFDGNKDNLFLVTTNDYLLGVIGVANCTFYNCRFHHISFIIQPDQLEKFKSQINFKQN